jgi:hypothetical protein
MVTDGDGKVVGGQARPPAVDFLAALKVVQDNLNAQAAITGRHERLNLVGHPTGCGQVVEPVSQRSFRVVGGDMPDDLREILERTLGWKIQQGGGGH